MNNYWKEKIQEEKGSKDKTKRPDILATESTKKKQVSTGH